MQKNSTIIGVIPQYPRHSKHNVYEKIKMPPVGLVSILTQLQTQNNNLEVYAIDENNYAGPLDFTDKPDHNFLQNIASAQIAMLYGGMSNSIPRMFSIAQQYQKFGAVTIAGGSHVDALPQEALNSGVDIVVHGEGEHIARELTDIILENGEIKPNYKQSLEQVSGISFLDSNGQHVFTGKRTPLTVEQLNGLENPDLDLIKFLERNWTAIPINRGRGCNFNCEFCVVNKQYGKYKACSVDKALEQVINYSEKGNRFFFFTDDNFAQNREQAIELCRKIGDYKRKAKKKIQIGVQIRSEASEDDELLDAMRYAGVYLTCIGFESPINEELRAMNKGVTVEQMLRRSRKLSKNNFLIHGMFIFGYPNFEDSKHTSDLTLRQKFRRYERFFRKSKVDTIQVLNAVPLPGSRLRKKLENEKRLLPLESVGWDKYDGLFLCYDPRSEGIDPFELQNLSRLLMQKRYIGNFFDRTLNKGNWMDWTYTFTAGILINPPIYYAKRFIHNLREKRRSKKVTQKLMPQRNIFIEPVFGMAKDIFRDWRNLFVKTSGGRIVKRWLEEYKNGDHKEEIKRLSEKKD